MSELENSNSQPLDGFDLESLTIPDYGDSPAAAAAATTTTTATLPANVTAAQFANMPPPPVIPMPKQAKDAVSKMLGTHLDYKHAIGDVTPSAAPNGNKPVGIPLPKNPQIVAKNSLLPPVAAKPSPVVAKPAPLPSPLAGIPAPNMMDALQQGSTAPPEKLKLKPIAKDVPAVVYTQADPPAPAAKPLPPSDPRAAPAGSATVPKPSATSHKPKPPSAAAPVPTTPKEAIVFDQALVETSTMEVSKTASVTPTAAPALVDKSKITKDLIKTGLTTELPPPSSLIGEGAPAYAAAPAPAVTEPHPMDTDAKPSPVAPPAAAAKSPATEKKKDSDSDSDSSDEAEAPPPPPLKLDPVTGKPKSILKKPVVPAAAAEIPVAEPATKPQPKEPESEARIIPKNQPQEAESKAIPKNQPKETETRAIPKNQLKEAETKLVIPRNDATAADDDDDSSSDKKTVEKEEKKKQKKEKKHKKHKKEKKEKKHKKKQQPAVPEPKKGKKRPVQEEEEDEEEEEEEDGSDLLLAEEASEVPEGEEEKSDNSKDEAEIQKVDSENIQDTDEEEEDDRLNEYEEDGFLVDDLAEEKERIRKAKEARAAKLKQNGKAIPEAEAEEDDDELDEPYNPKKHKKIMKKKDEKDSKRISIEKEIFGLQELLTSKLARIKRLRQALEPDEDPNEDEDICRLKEERRKLQAKVDELSLKIAPKKAEAEAEDEAEEVQVEDATEAAPMEEDEKPTKPALKKLDLTEETPKKPPAPAKKLAPVKVEPVKIKSEPIKKAAAATLIEPIKAVHPLDKPLGKTPTGSPFHTIKNYPTDSGGIMKDSRGLGSPEAIQKYLLGLLESTWIPFILLTMVDAVGPDRVTPGTAASDRLIGLVLDSIIESGKVPVSNGGSLESLSMMRTFFHVSSAGNIIEILSRPSHTPTMREGILLYIYDTIISPLIEAKLECEKTNPAMAALLPTFDVEDFMVQLQLASGQVKCFTLPLPESHAALGPKFKEFLIYGADATDDDMPIFRDVFHVDVIQQLCDLIGAFFPLAKLRNIITEALAYHYSCKEDEVQQRLTEAIDGDVGKLNVIRDKLFKSAASPKLIPLCKHMYDIWTMTLTSKKKHHKEGAAAKKAKY